MWSGAGCRLSHTETRRHGGAEGSTAALPPGLSMVAAGREATGQPFTSSATGGAATRGAQQGLKALLIGYGAPPNE